MTPNSIQAPRLPRFGGPTIRRAAILLVLVAATAQIATSVHHYMRVSRLREFAMRQAPLIAAIETFQVAHGSVPPNLGLLAPAVVPAPSTDTDICGATQYLAGELTELVGESGNPWMLVAYCRTWSIDHFVYLPNQKYPLSFEQIGQWGYHRG